MPWTFAHPAAALPLQRLCPKYLSFPALAVGCIAPDLGYYVGEYGPATTAHTFAGSFLVCLPSGLLVLALLLAFRKPVCYLLPQPHRAALTHMTEPQPFSALRLAIVSVSVVLGSWTHIAWDAFTHAGRWGAMHVALIGEPLFRLGTIDVHGYMLLQQLSTLAGTALLIWAYVAALRRHRDTDSSREFVANNGERKRWRLIALSFVTTFAIAMPLAYAAAAHESGYFAFGTFVFNSAIYLASVFVPVFVGTALFHYSTRQAQ